MEWNETLLLAPKAFSLSHTALSRHYFRFPQQSFFMLLSLISVKLRRQQWGGSLCAKKMLKILNFESMWKQWDVSELTIDSIIEFINSFNSLSLLLLLFFRRCDFLVKFLVKIMRQRVKRPNWVSISIPSRQCFLPHNSYFWLNQTASMLKRVSFFSPIFHSNQHPLLPPVSKKFVFRFVNCKYSSEPTTSPFLVAQTREAAACSYVKPIDGMQEKRVRIFPLIGSPQQLNAIKLKMDYKFCNVGRHRVETHCRQRSRVVLKTHLCVCSIHQQHTVFFFFRLFSSVSIRRNKILSLCCVYKVCQSILDISTFTFLTYIHRTR